MDRTILAVYVVEIARKLYARGLAFFRSGWNVFDFVPFILVATFTMLNLFIAIIVNTMESMHQAEHAREVAAIEEVVHGDSAQITAALQALRAEIAALRSMLAAQRPR